MVLFQVVHPVWTESDEFGSVTFAQVKTYGDTIHTFVERKNYSGVFLPGFKKSEQTDNLLEKLPKVGRHVSFHSNFLKKCISPVFLYCLFLLGNFEKKTTEFGYSLYADDTPYRKKVGENLSLY